MTRNYEHALYVGPANAVSLFGIEWRRLRDVAVRCGVRRVKCGRALLLPVSELRAALEQERTAGTSAPAAADPAATVRAALGLRRRA